ncbi:MAG: DsbA family protein [Acidimicrobiia bacterium]|nr:DsbA family protein [Acidimicrobiia bacterium]
MADLTIEYWADYLCPWCYLAQDRVRYLREQHGATMVWRPFELHPEIPPEGGPAPNLRRSSGAARWLRDELKAAGLPVVRRVTWSNTRRALGLSVWAADQPNWPDLHEALYHAYWAEGADLGEPTVLLRIAREVGIDSDGAAAALAEGSGLQEATHHHQRALDLGIGNTPGWHVGDGVVFTGVHERSVYDRVVARATNAS